MRRQLILLLVLMCAACSPTVVNRGNQVDPERLAMIKVGSSTREEVITKLGSPTQRATFDENTWYYIGRQTKQYSFLDPSVTEQEIVTIHFDDHGVVKGIDKLGKEAIADITPSPDATPTYGRDTSWLQDLFGNVGHAGIPLGKGSR